MNVYRGLCAKCGQTRASQLGWHWTPYRNTCDSPFTVTTVQATGVPLSNT